MKNLKFTIIVLLFFNNSIVSAQVGIGTIAPIATLQIETPSSSNQRTLLMLEPNSWGNVLNMQGSYLIRAGEGVKAGGLGFFSIRGDGQSFFGGNVGIGTTTPISKIHIKGTSDINSGLIIQGGDFGAGYGAMWVKGTGGAQNLYISGKRGDTGSNTTNDLTQNVVDSNIILNHNGGNVGIGTAPSVKLDVMGYIKIGSSDASGDATPQPGMIRFNTTTNKFQGYVGGGTPGWVDLY